MLGLRRSSIGVLTLLAFVSSSPAVAGSWTFEVPDPVTTISYWNDIVLDAGGQPWLAYGSRLAQRTPSGWILDAIPSSGSEPTPLSPDRDDPPSTHLLNFTIPSLRLTAGGEPRGAYIRMSSSVCCSDDAFYASRTGALWTQTPLSTFADDARLALDSDGEAWVLRHDIPAGPRLGIEQGGGFVEEAAPGAGPIRLGLDGVAFLAYANAPEYDVAFATRTPEGWVSEWVDTVGTMSGPQLLLDGIGQPRVAYVKTGAGVRYATRGSFGWTSEPVPAPVVDPRNMSFALDPTGVPCLAYSVGGDLFFARRSTGTWVTETVDTAGNVGPSPVIAIDAQGRPHIGYLDVSNSRIKYATSTPVVSVDPRTGSPVVSLRGAWPNPSRPGQPLHLSLRLDQPSTVTLELVDIAGRLVSRTTRTLPAGSSTVTWSPATTRAGLYRLITRTPQHSSEQRLTILN